MELTIIAAISENGVIGKSGKLPWHYSEDLKRFKQLTLNHSVLMGRKTYESILNYKGCPLENRTNIVLSSKKYYNSIEGVIFVNSLDEALNKVRGEKVYIIGGEKVYRLTLPLANKMEITKIHKIVEGDAFFPEYNKDEWKEVKREDREEYSFLTYKKY